MDSDARSTWAGEYVKMVDECQARDRRLSEWDKEFLGSIKTRLSTNTPLTLKQTEKLDEIWERVTARG